MVAKQQKDRRHSSLIIWDKFLFIHLAAQTEESASLCKLKWEKVTQLSIYLTIKIKISAVSKAEVFIYNSYTL